jgi:hypothetical protein
MNSNIQSLFRAQYLYQHILASEKHGHLFDVLPYDCKPVPTEGYLLLRSIDSLTDGERIILANCLLGEWSNQVAIGIEKATKYGVTCTVYFSILEWRLAFYTDNTFSMCTDIYLDCAADIDYKNYVIGIDYLKSLGILLPFTYLNENNKPITLTPQQIIDAGWAKYQTP